jgi:hypothetical protein
MRSVGTKTHPSANGGRNTHRSLKPYNAPKFEILTAKQAEAQLKGKGLPGDANAQQLLKIAKGLASRNKE